LYADKEIGQCSHYRENLKRKTDANTILDTSLWKYRSRLVEGVERALDDLNVKRERIKKSEEYFLVFIYFRFKV
jgi:hypothetical protein